MGESQADQVLQNQSSQWNLKGKLIVGFANPTAAAVQQVIRIDQKTSMKMLQNLLKLKKILENPPYSIDYFIIDSSPGGGFTTVNSMLITDINIFLVKVGNADINGSSEMIAGLIKHLENKVLIIANQVPLSAVDTPKKQEDLGNLIIQKFKKKINDIHYIGAIPTDVELQQVEFAVAYDTLKGLPPKRVIHILERPEHIFSRTIIEYIPKIMGEID
jgi:cellulose biosynthesis protein BcsQ